MRLKLCNHGLILFVNSYFDSVELFLVIESLFLYDFLRDSAPYFEDVWRVRERFGKGPLNFVSYVTRGHFLCFAIRIRKWFEFTLYFTFMGEGAGFLL